MNAKVLVRIPHLVWRDGRPRFEPGPGLRRLGYKGRDLRHADGRWYQLDEAIAFSRALAEEVAARRRAPAASRRRMPAASVAAGPLLVTVERLCEDWLAHPAMQPRTTREGHGKASGGSRGKSPATIRGYRGFMRALAQDEPLLWTSAAAALDRVICFNLYERMLARRGLATASAVIRTLQAALSFGMQRGWVPFAVNPCDRLGMETPAPRLRIAERVEIAHLVAAADALGRPEIGDAVMLGVWTGQRQGDRLALADEGLLNGRRVLRQNKTGALLAIMESPQLSARLAAMRERRAADRVSWREIVINEKDCRPFKPDHYRHVFAAIVAAATHGVWLLDCRMHLSATPAAVAGALKYLPGVRAAPARAGVNWLIAPMASLDGFRDQDLRDTAVTWLALAGCTLPEIAAVTGHELASITTIMKHYLARHPEMADHAVAKLVEWHG